MSMPARPEVRYAQSSELSIAYQVVGDGDIDLVYVPGFISHLDLAWDVPRFCSLFAALGRFCGVVMLDKRGTGLSDRSLGIGTVEDRMEPPLQARRTPPWGV